MSTLAVFLKVYGNEVSGSDLVESENLKELKNFEINYNIGHYKKNIKKFNPDFIVINFAINNENEELIWAKENKKKIITRSELLGKLSKTFKHTIAISGTHGKTTTTAMISEMFIEAGLNPTIHIGGIMKYNNSNFLIGSKKYFITEACEYKNSFLSLKPSVGIVLNVESDHLDFFKNLKEINQSFQKFLENSKSKIYLKNKFFIVETAKKKVFYKVKNIKKNITGYSFDLIENNQLIANFQTNFFGEHNIKNAVVAIITALFYKIKLKIIKKVIRNYHGVKRRFEKIGKIDTTLFIHDYAHHPTEIMRTITQSKDYGKVLTVFQPHTYSRTKSLFEFFLKAFNESDGLILVKTYSAREQEIAGGSAYDLFKSIKDKNHFDYINYAKNFEIAKEQILNIFSRYNCVLILGAGDIEKLAHSLFNK